uniref:Uncharacterized protein n=1 Tax=Rhizophora mucronata TaxID=61149 RepID=A0A2P2KAV6_RHIMU
MMAHWCELNEMITLLKNLQPFPVKQVCIDY